MGDDSNPLYASYGDPRSKGWASDNLMTVTSPSGVKVTVNKAAAPAFTGFLKDLEDSGYKIDQSQTGGYNLRETTGGNTLSPHAYGLAVDVNWKANPYSKNAQGGTLTTDLPSGISGLAHKWGLTWGGDWKSLKDPMHFQYDAGVPDTMEAKAQPQMTPQVQLASAPTNMLSAVPAQPQMTPQMQQMAQFMRLRALMASMLPPVQAPQAPLYQMQTTPVQQA
jgi:hypothetical protein